MKIKDLPERYKELAIKNQISQKVDPATDDRNVGCFSWSDTPEGWDFWHAVDGGLTPEIPQQYGRPSHEANNLHVGYKTSVTPELPEPEIPQSGMKDIETIKADAEFYCATKYTENYICEEQCNGCKKADQIEYPEQDMKKYTEEYRLLRIRITELQKKYDENGYALPPLIQLQRIDQHIDMAFENYAKIISELQGRLEARKPDLKAECIAFARWFYSIKVEDEMMEKLWNNYISRYNIKE